MFVADASLTLEWFLTERLPPSAIAALKLLRDSPLVVPSIWLLETQHGILKLMRQRVMTLERATNIRVELALFRKRVDGPLDQDAIDRIWEIARAHMLTFYDAVYVELARRLRIPIATLDTAMLAASKRLGIATV